MRALAAALDDRRDVTLVPVRWCAHREAIVRAEAAWTDGLSRYSGPVLAEPSEAGEPVHLSQADAASLQHSWLVIPEVTYLKNDAADASSPALAVALDYARYYGLRTAAVFYDLIPLRVPGYETMAAGHATYAAALAAADLILPISNTAAQDLAAWWRDQGHDLDRLPPIRPILLPAEVIGVERVIASLRPKDPPRVDFAAEPVRFLAVGTVEPRKNQLALMRAVNRLHDRRPELAIELDVVGGLHHEVSESARQEAAVSDGRIRLHQYLPDAALRGLMEACHSTVFISQAEGFGLPITEALWQGKPCLCSNVGSMAEIAAAGGCLMVDPCDEAAIEHGVERLAEDADLRASLMREACGRTLTNWSDYAGAVVSALDEAPPFPLLAIIEGTRGGGAALAACIEEALLRVWRHHWRADTGAIVPGFAGAGDAAPAIGRGDLRGLWSLLPLETTGSVAEAMRIVDEAHGLGLKSAVAIEAGRVIGQTELMLLTSVDLTLFATAAERDTALENALTSLPRVATLRHRFRVAGDANAAIAVISKECPRIAVAALPRIPKRIFYFTGLTATQPFNTGVQRVTRALGKALNELGIEMIPIKWDEAAGGMAPLDPDEAAHLARWSGPLAHAPDPLPAVLSGEWLIVPEITVPVRPAGSNIAAFARRLGMRTAGIFYDLIPLKMAHIYPPNTLAAFQEYWNLFTTLDVALPISWTVAAELRRYLGERGLQIPAIVVCPLAGDLHGTARQLTARQGDHRAALRLLAVGTWEPRKNYPAILRALMQARSMVPDRSIHLTIVGRRAGFDQLDAEINALGREMGNIDLRADTTDAELVTLTGRSDAMVFGSWEEGFGLPVLESLWYGLPCLCHDGSAMAEVAPGGGTLAVNMLDEDAIAQGLARLAGEPGLMDRLRAEAVVRPIRSWQQYGQDVRSALSRAGAAPGWPLPAILSGNKRPLLSCAITTYNRAHWLKHSLPRLIESARPFGDQVEVVVCDNTSTDSTPEVVARFANTPSFSSRRNPTNLGMLGNLGATARASNGSYIWIIGDDDLIIDGAIETILTGLETHPDVEMAYMNYAYTNFDAPEQLADPENIIRAAHQIGLGGANRRVAELREVAALNENLFTAIYACAFRRDHALRAYQQNVTGTPFSSLLTCIPSSVYALAALQNRPAFWVGQPAIVVNMNVSWLRWVLLWHLERMPDLFDAAELAGIDPVRIDRHRKKHCWNAGEWLRGALMQAEDPVREGVSLARLIERCKHLEAFKAELPKLRAAYTEAWQAGRVVGDISEADALFARYGL